MFALAVASVVEREEEANDGSSVFSFPCTAQTWIVYARYVSERAKPSAVMRAARETKRDLFYRIGSRPYSVVEQRVIIVVCSPCSIEST